MIEKTAGWLDGPPKMIPGETPYTEEELKKVHGLVGDAADGDPGEENEDPFKTMRGVRVTFKDRDDGSEEVLTTSINGTKKDILKYYLPYGSHGPWQDYDSAHPDRVHRAVKVEFLD